MYLLQKIQKRYLKKMIMMILMMMIDLAITGIKGKERKQQLLTTTWRGFQWMSTTANMVITRHPLNTQ